MELNDDKILDQSDYLELICTSISPIYDSIGDYFFMKYNEHKNINHNFVNGLKRALEALQERFKDDIKVKILKNISVETEQNWDDFNIYLIFNKIYYDYQLDIKDSEFPLPHTEPALSKKRTTINKLLEGFNYFLSLVEANTPYFLNQDKPKLNWLLNVNQLYMLFRELKSQGVITNTYEEIAEILKNNVQQLSDTAKSTILKEVSKKSQLPKNKRVVITFGISPKI